MAQLHFIHFFTLIQSQWCWNCGRSFSSPTKALSYFSHTLQAIHPKWRYNLAWNAFLFSWTQFLKRKIDLPHKTGQNKERCRVWKHWWGIRFHLCNPRVVHPLCGSQRASADRPSAGPRWDPGVRAAGSIPWRSEEHRQIQTAVSAPHPPTAPSAKGSADLNISVEIKPLKNQPVSASLAECEE